MYLDYWRLKEEPFKSGSDERFFFKAPQHQEAISRLLYAAREHKECVLLTGACGCGKSMACQLFLSKLHSSGRFAVAVVHNPLADLGFILQDVAVQLGGKPNPAISDAGSLFREVSAVLSERSARGFHCLVIIEEAQLLSGLERLEHLRLLLNLPNASGAPVLTLMLIGQPEVLRLLRQSPGLSQRLTVRWNIDPLTREQTRDYVSHRLSVAGGNSWIFDDEATDTLFSFCGGVARLINNAADMALYLGMRENAVRVDAAMVERVASDLHYQRDRNKGEGS